MCKEVTEGQNSLRSQFRNLVNFGLLDGRNDLWENNLDVRNSCALHHSEADFFSFLQTCAVL